MTHIVCLNMIMLLEYILDSPLGKQFQPSYEPPAEMIAWGSPALACCQVEIPAAAPILSLSTGSGCQPMAAMMLGDIGRLR
jgi:hypothetical protein